MVSSTGYYSCLKCRPKREVVEYGKSQIFKFDTINVDKSLRTKENYKEDLVHLENGIKGECVFGSISYFKPITSTNIDVMPSVFLGLIKKLFEYWFQHSLYNSYTSRPKLDELNLKLLSWQLNNHKIIKPKHLDV